MLSNKWTFSLTSLVVILALAFVVPSAMAGRFGTGFSVRDVSHEDGNQVEYGKPIVLDFNFGRSISTASATLTTTGDAADIVVDFLDKDNIPRGNVTLPTTLTQASGRTTIRCTPMLYPQLQSNTNIYKLRINIPGRCLSCKQILQLGVTTLKARK